MPAVGDAFTTEPVSVLNPVEGLQLYEVAPLAFKVIESPMHSDDGPFTVMTGRVFTPAMIDAVSVQPFKSVPVTVNAEVVSR
jgi:hypothetical protein